MPRALCVHCGDHPAALPAAVCGACLAQHHRDLAALPDWYDSLLARPQQGSGQRVSGDLAESPVPASDAALRCRARIRADLTAEVWWLSRQHDVPIPTVQIAGSLIRAVAQIRAARDAAAAAPSLEEALELVREMLARSRQAADVLRQLEVARGLDEVPLLVDHVTQHADVVLADAEHAGEWCWRVGSLVEAATAVAAPGRPSTVPIGRCPSCSSTVLADPSTSAAPAECLRQTMEHVEAWCTGCDERGVLRWWRTRLPPAEEWLTVSRLRMHLLIAHGVQVSEETPRKWAQRGIVPTRDVPGQLDRAKVEYHVPSVLAHLGVVIPTQVGPVHTVPQKA
jgi:hypothetical protein